MGLLLSTWGSGVSSAQTPAAGPAVETRDPMRCWWRSSTGAVAVGEPLDATLTCAVRENTSVRVVPDESRLGAEVIQLAPFEVLGGSHPADLHTSTHRLFQYHYTVRVIDRDAIGRDLKFPDLTIAYRVHDTAGTDTLEGRDRTYIVPGGQVRVLSLVPMDADDIRDAPGESFAQAESLRFTSRAFGISAMALGALGLIALASAAVGFVQRRTPVEAHEAGRVSTRAKLAGARATLDEVERESRAGWTPDLVQRAAAAARIAASCAVGHRVSEHARGRTEVPESGRLVIPRGVLRRSLVSLSSSTTAARLADALGQRDRIISAESRLAVEELRDSLATFTAALYRRTFDDSDRAIDEAMASAKAGVTRVARAHSFSRVLLRRLHSLVRRDEHLT
jgi:hypothetical protein